MITVRMMGSRPSVCFLRFLPMERLLSAQSRMSRFLFRNRAWHFLSFFSLSREFCAYIIGKQKLFTRCRERTTQISSRAIQAGVLTAGVSFLPDAKSTALKQFAKKEVCFCRRRSAGNSSKKESPSGLTYTGFHITKEKAAYQKPLKVLPSMV